jgi:large subunit ribosomal protein L21
MYAVIRTGGKQYKVSPQDVLQIEKIEGAAGDAVNFSDVLMVAGEGEPQLGSPLISGAVVSAEVVEQGRGPKIIIFKKKRRQNYRRKNGHRQALTTVRILDISLNAGATLRETKLEAQEEPAAKTRTKPKKSDSQAAEAAPQSEAQAALTAEPKKARAKVSDAPASAESEPAKKPRAPKKAAKAEQSE